MTVTDHLGHIMFSQGVLVTENNNNIALKLSVRFILQISLCFHPLHGYSIFPRGRKKRAQILRFTGQNTANWLLWYFVQQHFVRIFRKYVNCATVWVEHTYDRFKSKSNSVYWLWPVYALSVPAALLDYYIHDMFLAKIFISHPDLKSEKCGM